MRSSRTLTTSIASPTASGLSGLTLRSSCVGSIRARCCSEPLRRAPKQGLLAALFPERELGSRSGRLEAYCAALARTRQPLSIGVLGKCGANWIDGHLSLKEAIEHAAVEAGRIASIRWLA